MNVSRVNWELAVHTPFFADEMYFLDGAPLPQGDYHEKGVASANVCRVARGVATPPEENDICSDLR